MSTAYVNQAKIIGDRNRNIVTSNQGGDVFGVDETMELLRRFCVIGTSGGSFYASEQKLTLDAAEAVSAALDEHGVKAVDEIVRISHEGLAPSMSPGLFAFAMASCHSNIDVRVAAYRNLSTMARTASHLFEFMQYRRMIGKSSGGLRRALMRWYDEKSVEILIYQVIKYRQRSGFTHADILRMARGKPKDAQHNALYKWIVDGDDPIGIDGYQQAMAFKAISREIVDAKTAARIIRDYKLPREAVPTDFLNSPDVWDALLADMPLMATVRNLGKMSSVGLLVKGSDAHKLIRERLTNEQAIRKSRIHPINLFVAQKTYERGNGVKGSLTWNPVADIVDALDEGYRMAFHNVTPSGRRVLIAVDSSGSMRSGMTPNDVVSIVDAAAALAQIFAVTEPNADVVAFDTKLYTMSISDRQRTTDVARMISEKGGGGTAIDLPIKLAGDGNYDGIVIISDSEGGLSYKPSSYVTTYDWYLGGDASRRAVLMQMEYNRFSAIDTKSKNALALVGFDTSGPQLATAFLSGKF